MNRLKQLYGDSIETIFVDIFDEKAQLEHPVIWEQIKNRNLHVPVITVNNEVAVHGIISLEPVRHKISV